MQTLKKHPKHEMKGDIEIHQDADLRSAFEFWVRSVYLERRGAPPITSRSIAAIRRSKESPAHVS